MARYADREKATQLRLQGKSYSEIKATLGIPKSTLSGWLQDYPLSPEKIRELRDLNPRRIENYRNTRAKQREARFQKDFDRVAEDIKKIMQRDLFVGGFFLYWAEGTKLRRASAELTNTNPAMLRCFIEWLSLLGVTKTRLRVLLQLYADMDAHAQVTYWSDQLGIPKDQFRKPYIKKSNRAGITYKGGYGQGTCTVIINDQQISSYIKMGVKYVMEIYAPSAIVK